ncbi:MAG: hypothetical protein PUC73_05750 [Lachnospiraceae bacterium]|nr:hypothetical protein [Lachnospiraceae bacterium]
MKKRIRLLCVIGLMVLILGACNDEEEKVKIEDNMLTEYNQKICFILSEVANSNGFRNKGYFVMGDGAKYYFDLSEKGKKYADIRYLHQYLEENILDFEREEYLSPEDAERCRFFLSDVDSKAEVKTETVYFDGEQIDFYGVRYVETMPEFVLLKGTGAVNKELSDKNVGAILEILGEEWSCSSGIMNPSCLP